MIIKATEHQFWTSSSFSRVFKASHNAPDEIKTAQSWNLVLLNYFIYTDMRIHFINDKGFIYLNSFLTEY